MNVVTNPSFIGSKGQDLSVDCHGKRSVVTLRFHKQSSVASQGLEYHKMA